jgi:hypothetical protein
LWCVTSVNVSKARPAKKHATGRPTYRVAQKKIRQLSA